MRRVEREWDYADLATSYLKRPGYSPEVIDRLRTAAALGPGDQVCDVGAGTGNLTLPLLEWGCPVVAIEPDTTMRDLGIRRTLKYPNITWRPATAEATCEPSNSFGLVTFGSSFNVVNRPRTLQEVDRILQPGGWFACLWNHRDLADPLQAAIEDVINIAIPGYSYGVRREDQTQVIGSSGLFESVTRIEGGVLHTMSKADFTEGWKSHATLRNQAKDRFEAVLSRIQAVISDHASDDLIVPYTTRLWVARKCHRGAS